MTTLLIKKVCGIVVAASAALSFSTISGAAPPTFSPDTTRSFVEERFAGSARANDDKARALRAAVEFRSLMISDPGNVAVPAFAAETDAFKDLLSSSVYRDFPDAWSYFFSQSIPFIGLPHQGSVVTGFYAPFVDAIALADWSIDADSGLFSLNRLSFADGRSFRGDSDAQDRRAAPTPFRLSSSCSETFDIFNQRFATPGAHNRALGDAGDGARIVGERALYGLTSTLAAFSAQDPLGVKKVYADLFEALGADDVEQIRGLVPESNVVSRESLSGFPPRLLASFSPAFAVAGADRVLIYSQSAEFPLFLSVAEYEISANRDLADLLNFAIFKLEAGE